METMRINISLPKNMLDELAEEVGARERSRFIREAVALLLKKRKDLRLAAEYREAAGEMQEMNREMEGTLGDGLD